MEKTAAGKEKKKQKKDAQKGGGLGRILNNLKLEFSRIIWLDRDSLTKNTTAVIITSVALGAIIAVIDMIIKFGLGFMIA